MLTGKQEPKPELLDALLESADPAELLLLLQKPSALAAAATMAALGLKGKASKARPRASSLSRSYPSLHNPCPTTRSAKPVSVDFRFIRLFLQGGVFETGVSISVNRQMDVGLGAQRLVVYVRTERYFYAAGGVLRHSV